MTVTFKRLVLNGEYLGHCDQRGYIYSIFSGYDESSRPQHSIYAVHGNALEHLITYPIINKEEKL
jgi:hypothetical protein